MKIQDIITENQASVRESRLNEFAPGGSEGNGPFEYGTAIIQIGQDFAEFYDDEGTDADARAIIKVGNTFMSAGMEAGIRAFYAMDTQVRDHVAEQLEDLGFNVRQDIYQPYDQQFTAAEAAKGIQTILALLKEFSKTVEEPEDRKTVAGIYKAFQQGMKPGFVALRNAFEFDIDADFYDFARDRGIDLDKVAAQAGFDTDSLLEVKQGVTEGDYPDGSSLRTPSVEEWKLEFQKAKQRVMTAKTQQEYEAASDRASTIKDLLASRGVQVGPVLGEQGVSEGQAQPLTVAQLATISDEALDQAYGYGRSTPGNTFGWQANLKSAAYAKKMIDSGVTDIEAISDAIHKGWNVTAQAFVQNPDQFADTEKLRAAGKLQAKLDQRAKLMRQDYAQLADEEKEKDRVVARALLQALRGEQA